VELSRRARQRVARLSALLWVSVLVPWTAAPASLEVHALDVGHGTAVLLRSPGGAVWVFDAGSRDRQEVDREALAPVLRTWDAARVGVVLSHPDRDHDGALGWLADRYPPALWAGALPAQVGARLPHTTPRVDVVSGRMALPEIDPGGGGPSLELSRGLDVEGNEGSRTLEVAWGGRRIVLCGDAESEGLAAWLSARPRRSSVRMLLFPHHGSDTDRIAALLAALQPEEVWISASGTPAVSSELRRRRIRCRITSEEGPLRLELP
jgi:competence protein ComEC